MEMPQQAAHSDSARKKKKRKVPVDQGNGKLKPSSEATKPKKRSSDDDPSLKHSQQKRARHDSAQAKTHATPAGTRMDRAEPPSGSSEKPSGPSAGSRHAFTVDDPRDHAETPFEAYRDLEPLLFRLAQELGKPKTSLRIYDPYYCAGTCVTHLGSLGFTNVYNRNEDFYAIQAEGRCPEFDVLVTNPPFSADHMRRALEFAASCGKPWALLMPDFVARKAYYSEVLCLSPEGNVPLAKGKKGASKPEESKPEPSQSSQPKPLANARISASCGPLYYLGPTSMPYKFTNPSVPGDTDGTSQAGGRTFTPAAFQCVWFLGLGRANAEAIIKWWNRKQGSVKKGAVNAPGAKSVVAADVSLLPQLAMDRNRKRRQEAERKKAAKAAAKS